MKDLNTSDMPVDRTKRFATDSRLGVLFIHEDAGLGTLGGVHHVASLRMPKGYRTIKVKGRKLERLLAGGPQAAKLAARLFWQRLSA